MNINTIGSAGWDKLTEQQKADIVKQVADNSAKPIQQLTDPNQIDQWVELGEHIGKAFSGAAKEVGIAVSQFIETPVGKVTVLLIVLKLIGSSLIHIFGAFFVIIAAHLAIKAHKRMTHYKNIQYDEEKRDIFGRAVIKSIKEEEVSSDLTVGYIMIYLSALIISTLIFVTA